MRYVRFSICVTPAPDSDLARMGRHWLGWDMDQATELPLLKIEKLPVSTLNLVARIRRFGFQAPLTHPFGLARGHNPLDLHHTCQALATHLEVLEFAGLYLSAGRAHLALRPIGDMTELDRLRNVVEQVFAEFKAPAAEDRARNARRRSELSTAQMKAVIDQRPPERTDSPAFEFALTDGIAQEDADLLRRKLLPILSPNLPRPFHVQSLSLCGEDSAGWFRVIQRYSLSVGNSARSFELDKPSAVPPQVPLWS